MGTGRHNPSTENLSDQTVRTENYKPPQLPSLSEIKVQIPSHCFRPTVYQSMSYVVKDIIYVALTFLIMSQIEKYFHYGYLVFPLYWYIQGTFYTSFFVLGHDCGHGSFSFYPLLNDVIGTILHSWIMAPYYPWKLTHNVHHKNTNNIDKDEVFYPSRNGPRVQTWLDNFLLWSPGFGWFHYLWFGYNPRATNHYNLFEPLFFNKHAVGVSLSLLAYAGMCYFMFLYSCTYGFQSLIVYHLIPVFIFASYMVIITMLHHTEVDVPWYADSEWNNVKGQLSTVDRHYGHVHSIIHCIGTHQIHHLFTKVPHYHLEEATAHFRRAFPDLVRINPEPILFAFHRMCKLFIKQRGISRDTRVFTYTREEH